MQCNFVYISSINHTPNDTFRPKTSFSSIAVLVHTTMKSSLFRLFLLACWSVGAITDLEVPSSLQAEESNVAKALSEVLIFAHAKKSSVVNFIICASVNNTNHQSLVREVLKIVEAFVKYQVETCESLSDVYKRRFVILFIDSHRVRDLLLQMTPNQFDFSGYYLLHFLNHDIDHSNIERLFKGLLDKFIYNANVLTAGDSINLTTFHPFTEDSCRSTKPVVVNENINGAWNTTVFYPQKMKNLHKCPLKVAAFLYSAAVMIKENYSESNFTLEGSDVVLLQGMADVLNFTIEYLFDPKPGAWGVC